MEHQHLNVGSCGSDMRGTRSAYLSKASRDLKHVVRNIWSRICLAGLMCALSLGGPANAGPLQEARIVTFPFGPFPAILYIARDNGIFEKNGITPKFVSVASGPMMQAALVSGQADFGQIVFQGATALIFQGEDILFLTGDTSPFFNLIATKGSIKSIADLRGTKIGVTARGALTEYFARAVLTSAGLNPDKDVTFVATGALPSAIAAFQAGQVDATVTYPPMEQKIGDSNFTMLVNNLKEKKYFRGVSVDGIATTRALLDRNPRLVENFCSTLWESLEFSRDPANLAKVAKTVATLMDINVEQAAAFWKSAYDNYDLDLPESRWYTVGSVIVGPYANKMPDYKKFVYEPCASDVRKRPR